MSDRHEMVGKVFPTNYGGDCIVIGYFNSTNIEVQFLDENKHEVMTSMKSIKLGCIKNPYAKSAHGVGYLGVGDFKTACNRKHTKAYILWSGIIERCYSKHSLAKNPTYVGCTVHEDWHNFQVFAKWYYEQPFNNMGYHLDKDVLSVGAKVYSAGTCCFIPREINNLFNTSESSRTNMPQGVFLNKKTGKFVAQLGVGSGKRKYLGSYNSPERAYQAYKVGKEAYVEKVTLSWKGKIDDKVFEKLMDWTLD